MRPHPLDDGIAEKIANRLIADESVRQICRDKDMPSQTEFYVAMAIDDRFRSIITRAREAAQDASIDTMIDIADAATPEDVQVAKLRIWARQWRAGKLAPKKYGDQAGAGEAGVTRIEIIGGPVRRKAE